MLLIHGDDDRNVPFSESVDLIEALERRNVHVEQLVFPDEVHSFLLHRNWLAAYRATADFFDRMLADLDTLRKLDLPSLFAYTEDPDGARSRYAVLAGLKGEEAVVYDPLSGRRVVPAPVLLKKVEGPIYFLLKHAEEGLLREGGRGSEVMSLQEQLKEAGFFAEAPTGFYGSATSEAVRSLQREHDLEVDGAAGMETRILLARLAGRFIPSLSDPR